MDYIYDFPQKYQYLHKYVKDILLEGEIAVDHEDSHFVGQSDHITYTGKFRCTVDLKSGKSYTITAITPAYVAAHAKENLLPLVEAQAVIIAQINREGLLDGINEWLKTQEYLNDALTYLGAPLTADDWPETETHE
jgi:hypothetical protein